MSQASNKVEWCLRKAEKELKEGGKHRGIVKVKPDIEKAKSFINKAERFLRATEWLKKGDLSDVSTSTVFYCMYDCLQAIAAKHGYDSRNQECTFALIYHLIEEGSIDFDKEVLEKIASVEPKDEEQTSVSIRERYQYGTEAVVDDAKMKELINDTREFIEIVKVVLKK